MPKPSKATAVAASESEGEDFEDFVDEGDFGDEGDFDLESGEFIFFVLLHLAWVQPGLGCSGPVKHFASAWAWGFLSRA